MSDPENIVLLLLREMRAEMETKSDLAKLEGKLGGEIADLRSEVHSLRADFASDLLTLEKRLKERISGLRRTVIEYHSSAMAY